MSIDKSKDENNTKIDIRWNVFIEHAQSEITACQQRIANLRK